MPVQPKIFPADFRIVPASGGFSSGHRIRLSLPSRTLGGGGFGSQFGDRERARSARHAPDGLKMNYVQMKTSEL